jgi:hypothetical protein
MFLSWTRMEEPFAATLLIIVPAAGRGHVRPVVSPLVNRLGLSLPLGPLIHPIGYGRVPWQGPQKHVHMRPAGPCPFRVYFIQTATGGPAG